MPETPERRAALGESLEIQAYEEFCAPEPAGNGGGGSRRPFVGALTLQLPTASDDEVLSWIADGPPPIYFGFGSTPVTSPADTLAVINAACTRLGERGLICSGPNDFADIPHDSDVKVVAAVNHAAVLPTCRALVHHGGAGTTAAGMRAGVPMVILWLWLDQPLWAAAIERLKIGVGRPFSATTLDSLVADLRMIRSADFGARARDVATRMTKPAESVAGAADLLEVAAQQRRIG